MRGHFSRACDENTYTGNPFCGKDEAGIVKAIFVEDHGVEQGQKF